MECPRGLMYFSETLCAVHERARVIEEVAEREVMRAEGRLPDDPFAPARRKDILELREEQDLVRNRSPMNFSLPIRNRERERKVFIDFTLPIRNRERERVREKVKVGTVRESFEDRRRRIVAKNLSDARKRETEKEAWERSRRGMEDMERRRMEAEPSWVEGGGHNSDDEYARQEGLNLNHNSDPVHLPPLNFAEQERRVGQGENFPKFVPAKDLSKLYPPPPKYGRQGGFVVNRDGRASFNPFAEYGVRMANPDGAGGYGAGGGRGGGGRGMGDGRGLGGDGRGMGGGAGRGGNGNGRGRGNDGKGKSSSDPFL